MKKGQTEKQFMAMVIRLARLCGWSVYHVHDSRRSAHGWPDLVLCRPPRLLFVELKTDVGETTTEQEQWLGRLQECDQVARVWRPRDWKVIEAVLMGQDTNTLSDGKGVTCG